MSVHAVVTGVEAASNEPFPKRRVRCVQGLGPVAVPVEQVGVLPEALGEMFLAEALTDLWVGRISLGDEACRWVVVLLRPPMDGNLCLADRGAGVLRCCHGQPPCGEELMSTLHRSPAMGTRSFPSHGDRVAPQPWAQGGHLPSQPSRGKPLRGSSSSGHAVPLG